MAKSKVKLTPLNDRVIVKQSQAEETTASGIVLPEAAQEKPTRGEIVAVGPGRPDDKGGRLEMSVKVGDEVYYGKYVGTEVEVDGEKYVIVRESDLLGVLE